MSLRHLSFLPLLFSLFSCTSYQTGSGSAPVSDETLLSVPVPPAAHVVDSLLASMTIDEKVGQMLMVKMPGNYVSTQGNEFERLKELIADIKPGGMILLQGDVYETAMLLNKLQRLSRLPLLVGADLENGLAMRLRKATWFPSAMAVGATRSPAYAYAIGRATADEARAVGIHQNYAPVVDINTNPDNPIINTRAYSDESGLVDTMAGAYIRGLQEGGVIATLKHFPGHGSGRRFAYRVAGDQVRQKEARQPGTCPSAAGSPAGQCRLWSATWPCRRSIPRRNCRRRFRRGSCRGSSVVR